MTDLSDLVETPETEPRADGVPHGRAATAVTDVPHMKWWGWGVPGVGFHHEDKPAFAPFVSDKVGLDITGEPVVPPELESLPVPVPKLTDAFLAQLTEALGEEHVHTETLDRIVHTYGKSLRDLVRLRRAIIPRIPDAVLYPTDEDQVRAIVDLAVATARPINDRQELSRVRIGADDEIFQATRPVLVGVDTEPSNQNRPKTVPWPSGSRSRPRPSR